ncbi:unnamed protein product [Toxocara canis]|uniref:AMP-binding domain-containing protein n=1 Tax=Toxocara canis TaxID=6265 RepID=A0A183UFT1_TOXCA|nr:unnamed protein product [Toxocara canis]
MIVAADSLPLIMYKLHSTQCATLVSVVPTYHLWTNLRLYDLYHGLTIGAKRVGLPGLTIGAKRGGLLSRDALKSGKLMAIERTATDGQ